MALNKPTKLQRFADISAMLKGEEPANGTTLDEALSFINHEMEMTTKKNASKSKKDIEKQANNELLKNLVLGVLDDCTGKTCTEIQKDIPELANFGTSKVTFLLRSLIAEGKVTRIATGKNPLFKLS